MTRRSRVLIVDDEPISTQFLKNALQGDYEVGTARSGAEAIAMVHSTCPDLVLLDVMLPDTSGFEVCRRLKSEEPFGDLPILFVTALDDLDSEILGLGLGGIDYLKKPVNLSLLRQRVLNHLELKRRSDLVREQRDQLERQKTELEEALARVKRLEGILCICAGCKRIRDDGNQWKQLESYLSRHSDARFSHGLCPECYAKALSELPEE